MEPSSRELLCLMAPSEPIFELADGSSGSAIKNALAGFEPVGTGVVERKLQPKTTLYYCYRIYL
jgi:hypothetical protein